MRFLQVFKKIHETGFDEFHQAGVPNRFHPMNIVCQSRVLNLQYWVCAEGGYNVRETYHIASRPLDNYKAPTERVDFETLAEMIAGLETIRLRIAEAMCSDKNLLADKE